MNLSPENKFFSFMSLVGDLILLNVLFVITSLPILTFGASSCALYLSVKKRIYGEESYIVKDYLNAWKENLKDGVCIWAILLAALVGMVFFTSYVAAHLTNLAAIILYSFLFMWLSFTLLYAFPLQATFINTPLRILLNSILTALRHLPWTVALFFTTYVPMILSLAFPRAISLSVVYWCLIGCSLSMVFSALILKRALASYLPKEADEEAEAETNVEIETDTE